MTLFAYTARAGDGSLVESRVEAPTKGAVAAELLRTGITPVQIEEIGENQPAEFHLRKPRVLEEDQIFFCRQMYRLSRAGVPLVRAITGIAESTRNPALSEVLQDVIDALQSGRGLSESLRAHPKAFPSLFVSILSVGENTGQLDAAFDQMAKYLERDRENRRRIQTAMRYPMIVVGSIGAAMAVVNIWVIPAFAKAFAEFGAELPLATRILIASSNFMVAYWPHLLAAGGCVYALVKSFLSTPEGRLGWDRARLRIPVIGTILHRGTLARFSRSLAATTNAGVPILNGLDVVAGAMDNAHLTDRLADMSSRIERGETMTRAASACGIFDSMVLQMMAVGEETGTLNEMLEEIADTYEAEVEYDLKRLSELIEPMLIVGVAGVVVVLALGVYLPMWNLAGAALH